MSNDTATRLSNDEIGRVEMTGVQVVKPNNVKNSFYHNAGLGLLFLNKIRYSLRGYKNARPFPTTEIQRAIEYDYRVVEAWLEHLDRYSERSSSLKDKAVLELGPGADLGAGLILLAKGAKKYNALDKHNLIKSAPQQFYDELFNYLERTGDKEKAADTLKSQLKLTLQDKNDKLNYLCRDDFDISAFEGEDIDLVFSQAAFEHFDDLGRVFSQLRRVVKSGAILIAEVDLQTHTRWIRDADPLNIYRYLDWTYGLFKFAGSPNRVRPLEYQKILEKNGWRDIQIQPLVVLDSEYMSKVQNSLGRRFRDSINQMSILSMMICATKE